MLSHRYALPLMAALMLSTAPAALADDFILSGKINDVTVFKDGASVTRLADITLPAGNHTITVKGLPSTLDTHMVRAAFDKRGITVRRLSIKQVHSNAVSDTRRQKIKSAIETLQSDIRVLNDKVGTAQIQLDYITRLSPPTGTGDQQAIATPSDLQGILEFMGRNGNSLKETIRTTELKKRELLEEINRLQRELGGGRDNKYSYEIIIKAYAAQPQKANLSLTYHVDDAEWWLKYDADINSKTNMLNLTQYAQVVQETGENWTGASITLSTEEPSLDVDAPELKPKFVDVIDPQIRLRNAKRKVMERASAQHAPEADTLLQGIIVTASRRINTDFSTSFKLIKGANITSSPDEQAFELMKHEQKIAIKAVVIPHNQETAFLYGDFTYNGDSPLYAGAVELFRNGTFAGSSTLSTIQVGQEASFAMGQDSKIAVTFIDEGQNKDEKGLFTKDTEKAYRYAYTIENHHDRSFPVEVRAVRPTSVNEKLVIEALGSSTKPTTVDWEDLKGVYAWNKDIAAGKSWTIKHHYKLKFPKDMRVVGKR